MNLSLLKRDSVARLLNVEKKYVYKIFNKEGLRGGLIPEEVILSCLNKCGVNVPKLERVPQLYTMDEMLKLNSFGRIDHQEFTEKDIIKMSRRKLFPIPHYKIGKKTIRFPKYALAWWITQVSKPLKQRDTYDEPATRETLDRLKERNLFMVNNVIKHM